MSPSQRDPAPVFDHRDCFEANLDRAAGDVIDGEAIIIDLVTGVYYSMQGVGGDIWSMISARRSLGSMLEEIVGTYDVAPDDARRDLGAVLGQLVDEELIQLSSNGDGSHTVQGATAKKRYERPLLQVYRDMQELLALDPPAPGMNQIAWDDRHGSSANDDPKRRA
jgi:hypothetical protein